MLKTDGLEPLGRSDVVSCGRRKGFLHLVKSEQNVRVFFAVSTALPGVGLSKRICKNAFSVAGAVQETCSTEMLEGQG